MDLQYHCIRCYQCKTTDIGYALMSAHVYGPVLYEGPYCQPKQEGWYFSLSNTSVFPYPDNIFPDETRCTGSDVQRSVYATIRFEYKVA